MAHWLRLWIPSFESRVQNQWVASKLAQLFHSSKVDQSKLSPRSDSVALKQFNPIYKKRP